MWSQWLARTLRLRPVEENSAGTARLFQQAMLPDLECDGLHPGADEFRSAMDEGESARADRNETL